MNLAKVVITNITRQTQRDEILPIYSIWTIVSINYFFLCKFFQDGTLAFVYSTAEGIKGNINKDKPIQTHKRKIQTEQKSKGDQKF